MPDPADQPEPPAPSGAVLRVNRSCAIPLGELEWRYSAAGGPGGQHANRSHTRVELVFDVEASAGLGPRQRQRLLDRIGPVVRVTAADERSQARNRDLALERMRSRLAEALRIERPRVATAPTRGAKERRLEQKRRRSDIKRSRQSRVNPDD